VPLNELGFAAYPARTVTEYGLDGITPLSTMRFVDVVAARALPANVTWNLQLDQVITRWLSCRVSFLNSRTDHVAVVDPVPGPGGSGLLTLSADGASRYHALELTERFTLPKKSALYVSYVHSSARGDLNTFDTYFGDIATPIIRPNQYSNLLSSVPNRLVAWGEIALPSRVTIAPIVEYRDGFPFSVRDAGQFFVGVRNADATRFPHFLSVDGELAKEFQVTKRYAVRLSVRGFNLTNHFNPRDVRANIADPGFGSFFAPYRRYLTGGFDIVF
jgi:hypothetical protein